MLLDTHSTYGNCSFLEQTAGLPEWRMDKYRRLSSIMEDLEQISSGVRESALPFMAVCANEIKIPVTVFEPLKGMLLNLSDSFAAPYPIDETPFFYDRPYMIFQLLLKGHCRYTLAKEEEVSFDLLENDFLAGDCHEIYLKCSVPAQEVLSHVGVSVTPEAVREHFGRRFAEDMKSILHFQGDGSPRCVPFLRGPASPDLISSGRRLLAMRKDGPLDAMELRSASLDFLTRMLRNAALSPKAPSVALPEHEVLALTRLKERIERNCLENTSIVDLCASVVMSESKANRAFKQLFNVTIARHLHNCKMQYAHDMLSARKCNVSECAFEVGYTSISHFISAYRKQYGQTPGNAFRRGA